MTIAQTILSQLGGRRFVAMTGAKNFIDCGDYLTFKLSKNASRATHVKIKLDPSDTYVMEFIRVRGTDVATIKITEMIYAESLRTVFEEFTGLRTSL